MSSWREADEPFDDELSLSDYVAILNRHRLMIIAIIAAALILSLVSGLRAAPTFEARSRVTLRTDANQSVFPFVGRSQTDAFTLNPTAEVEFMRSEAFRDTMADLTPEGAVVTILYAAAAEGVDGGFRSTAASEVTFVGEADNAQDAATASDIWATSYVELRQQLTLDEADSSIVSIQAELDLLIEERDAILAPLAPIDAALLVETDSDVISGLATQRLSVQQALSAEVQPVEASIRVLATDLGSLERRADLLERDEILARVARGAAGGRQTGPNPARNVLLGLIVGSIAAVGAALLRDNLQTTIASRADVERVTKTVPVIAQLPEFDEAAPSSPSARALADDTTYVEAIERLVTAVGLVYRSTGLNRFVVTSALPGEGKTTVSAHLGIRLGLSDVRTVVLDADMRRPNLHRELEMQNDGPGLSSVLQGTSPLDSAVRQWRPDSPLSAVLAGPIAATQSAALVRSEEFADVVSKMSVENSVVIVDSPPVLPVVDAQTIAAVAVDHAILVVRAGSTKRPELAEALDRLSSAGRTPIGIVLTGVTKANEPSYAYSYASES